MSRKVTFKCNAVSIEIEGDEETVRSAINNIVTPLVEMATADATKASLLMSPARDGSAPDVSHRPRGTAPPPPKRAPLENYETPLV